MFLWSLYRKKRSFNSTIVRLKGYIRDVAQISWTRFNSTIVRLKAEWVNELFGLPVRFNSTIVRLKVVRNDKKYNWFSIIQLLNICINLQVKLSKCKSKKKPALRQLILYSDFQYVKERITAIARFFFQEYTSTDNRLQEVIDTTPLFPKYLLIQPFFLPTWKNNQRIFIVVHYFLSLQS